MNILVISTVRYRANGIANVIRNLYCNEEFNTENISFLFPFDNDESMISELENLGYHVYQYPRYEEGLWGYFLYIIKIVKERKIEVVHVHGNSHALLVELLAATIGGCKVRVCHSHNTTCNNIFLHKMLSPLFNFFCTDRFACGYDAGKWMYGKRKFTVIHNGIKVDKFRFNSEDRNHIRSKYNIPEDVLLIGNVGNLNRQKNQKYLIEIVDILSKNVNCQCILVGEGEEYNGLKKRVGDAKLEEKVVFCGVTDNVPAYLSAMDVLVMPSIYEGLPLSMIEAQTSGLKCIVSDIITKEANISGLVDFLPLGDCSIWCEAIASIKIMDNRDKISELAIDKILNSEYCIEYEISKLKKYFQERVEKSQ